MPNDWKKAKIGDVAEKVAIGPFGSSIKVETFVPNGIPVISGQHLHGTRLADTEYNFITYEHAERLKNANVFRGDVLFTHAGNIGQAAYIPQTSKYDRYIISQRQFYMRCDQSKVIPEFVAYFFHTPEGRHKLLANASSVGVPSIAQPVTYLRTIEMPVPPVSEQRAIAGVLGALDDKIELNRRMNETLEALAQALFQSWFVDVVQAGMPEGWRWTTIRELASNIQYGLTQSASTEPVGPRFLRISDIQGGRVDWGAVPYCEVSPEEHERYRIQPGDVLVARTGASTGENIYLPVTPDAVFASYLVRFQFSDPAIARLVGAFMRTTAYFDYVAGSIGGSAQPNASAQVLSGAQLAVPTPDSAQRFAEILAPLDKRIAANNEESRTLAALRDTLLPKLLSGAVRVTGMESNHG